jgi:transketolase
MLMAVEARTVLGTSGMSLREAFGRSLCDLADEFKKFVVLDADVAGDTGTHHFRKSHPDRFLQFGIAEQNMMAAAGGLAAVGYVPIVTTLAAFCLRAMEQTRLSLAFARRNAKIVATHGGLDAGPEGGVLQALEDLAAFRAIPGMTVISPADPIETALATRAILQFDGPVYMRTGSSPAKRLFAEDHRFEIGKGRIIRDGVDVTIVACGVEVVRALEASDLLAKEGISARVVNMATIKPIDATLLTRCAAETGAFVTAEDHNIHGGLGSAVAESLAARSPCPIEFVGVKDVFGLSGDPEALAEKFGMSAPYIALAAKRAIERKHNIAGRRKNFR